MRGADFHHVDARRLQDVPTFALAAVEHFSGEHSWPVPDTRLDRTARLTLP